MTDYRINLAKTIVSTPEERQTFYHRMLIYLVICAGAMVFVSYLAASNILKAHQANKQSSALIKGTTTASGFSKTFFKDPATAYQEMEVYAADLEILRDAFSKRSHFLPVISELFKEFPDGVTLQGLSASASSKQLSFGLVLPLSNQEKVDPVRQLQATWNGNENLMNRVESIRPITGERRMVGDEPVFFVQFECLLK